MQPSLSNPAIILRSRLYGESDKIVTFLTLEHGKLTGIAKGAKNSRRRFANCLEPFTLVRVHYRTRPNASLAFMVSCDLLQPASDLVDPVKFAYASYLTELVDLLTIEGQPAADLHALLAEGLTALRGGPATSGFLRTFELRLLHDVGYAPQLTACHQCDATIAGSATGFLDARHGRVLCRTCQPQGVRDLEYTGDAAEVLESLRQLTLEEGRTKSLRGPEGSAATVLLGRLLHLHIARPLRSLDVIAALQNSR